MMITASNVIPFHVLLELSADLNVWDAWAAEFGPDTSVTLSALVERVMNKVGLRAGWVLAWELQTKERRRDALLKMFNRLASGDPSGLAARAALAQESASAFDWAALSVDARCFARQLVAENNKQVAIVWAVEAACHEQALAVARAGVTAVEYMPGEEGRGDTEMMSQVMDLLRGV